VQIKLLATDLDGTLFSRSESLSLYDDFRSRLQTLRTKHDALWVVCTGRSLRSFQNGFASMQAMGLIPDYVIVNHAYIYRRSRNGYRPHYTWNFMIHYHMWSSRLYMKEAIQKWHKLVTDMSDNAKTIYYRRNRLCFRFTNEEEAQAVAKLLEEKSREFRHLRVFRFEQEVDVRMVPFTKGLALENLATHLGIGASSILAIGNGHNDISMLDGTVAKYVGCPDNAETDVMQVVNKVGGHVASRKVMGGVVDVIDAYLDDCVNSELPDWWVANKHKKNPKSTRRQMNHSPKHKQQNKKRIRTIIIVVMISYSVLLAFANFGVIPMSGLIRKPVKMLMDLIVMVLELFS